jgi:hypothetical protein
MHLYELTRFTPPTLQLHEELEQDKIKLKGDLDKLKVQAQQLQTFIQNQRLEETKLRRVVSEADAERVRQTRDLEAVMTERDLLASQMVRRNEELSLVYEKVCVGYGGAGSAGAGAGGGGGGGGVLRVLCVMWGFCILSVVWFFVLFFVRLGFFWVFFCYYKVYIYCAPCDSHQPTKRVHRCACSKWRWRRARKNTSSAWTTPGCSRRKCSGCGGSMVCWCARPRARANCRPRSTACSAS